MLFVHWVWGLWCDFLLWVGTSGAIFCAPVGGFGGHFSPPEKHEKSHAKAREKSEASGPRSAFWVGLLRCLFVPWVGISLLFLVHLVVNCAERALARGLEFLVAESADAKRQGQSQDKNREGIWVGFAGAIFNGLG